jgi:hypothetical protein
MSEHDLLRLISEQLEALRKDVQGYQIDTTQRLATIETKLEPLSSAINDAAKRIDNLEDSRTQAKTMAGIISTIVAFVATIIIKIFWH